MFLFRLPGKSGDYVGGDAAVWEKLPQVQNALVEKSGVVSTAHAPEHTVTAALE